MAKGKKKGKKRRGYDASQKVGADGSYAESTDEGQVGTAVEVAEEGPVVREAPDAPKRKSGSTKVGGLSIYKPGQGYYTRVGTALFSAVLIAGLWNYLYSLMELWEDPDQVWTFYLRLAVPSVVGLGVAALVYWLVGKRPGTCDFLILTEGEMKKVSWSSKKEVIGSTYVVIFVVLAMGALLAVADLVFATIFWAIGVLEKGPFG